MPKRRDINKVMVIGSGPIVIGQAAEFDYAGTQACEVLKDAGVEVVLVNSNPATIMTDGHMADHVTLSRSRCPRCGASSKKSSRTASCPRSAGRRGLRSPCSSPKRGFWRSTA